MLRLPDSWVWDFWLVREGEKYHAFFLYASRALGNPDLRHRRAAIGHAVSTDLLTWERVADAVVHGSPPSFDQTATWTGCTVRGGDGRWYLFYTGMTVTDEGRLLQQIGLATSDDLLTWTKDERNPLVRADPRWYETLAGSGGRVDEQWRDPFVLPDLDGDGWHMLITARVGHGPYDERGVIGHATSPDLLTWTVRPPLSEPGAGFVCLEVPQVEVIDGRGVLLFCCTAEGFGGARAELGGPGGIYAASAESLLGPFDIAGAAQLTDERLYVGKVVKDPTGAWVFLAFRNQGDDGAFVGELIDPLPVGWEGDRFIIDGIGPVRRDATRRG